ncbi:M23 family metallopeptidase [Paenibacillus sp. IITD108]
MTDFRDMSRIKKFWNQTIQYVRGTRSQDLKGKSDQQEAAAVAAPLWRRKSVQIIGGAVILLTAAGLIGYQQYTQYIKANTFEFFHVSMNGQEIGTVSSTEQVDELIASKLSEVKAANPDLQMELNTGLITYESESAFKPQIDADATLSKLGSMFTSYAVGVEVKVDGKVVGVVKDQETADSILLRIQGKYAPELVAQSKNPRSVMALSYNKDGDEEKSADAAADEEVKPGRVVSEVEFVEKVDLNNTNIDPEAVEDPEQLYKRLTEGSPKPTKYVVQKGDCVGCIAHKFDISPQVIYENNPWIKDDMIRVGDELDLTAIQPEITVRTAESLVEVEAIAAPVEVQKNNTMPVGQSKVIQEGVEGSQRLTYRISKENGYVISEELISKEVLLEPVPEIVEKGTMVVIGEGSGKFALPVTNYRITSKFGQRWGRLHKGVDFTGNKTILASDAGEVEFVGRKSGLGNTVIINHKNGYKTVYGHLSSYKVSKGDKVKKGASIAIMGNTGNSTGTHLHFEIHKNGVAQNPLKYL